MEKFQEIENIEEQISKYYEMVFEHETDDYIYNKKLKNKLKKVILNSKKNEEVIEKALFVLARTTGCAEDQEIAEEIINDLFESKVINKKHLDIFYNNLGTNRWI
jgi:hypothetical protein